VKARLHRARLRLRDLLAGYLGFVTEDDDDQPAAPPP
jgi:hypothetical protein